MTPTDSRGAAIGTGRVPRGCETGVEQDACTAASTDAPASPSRRCGSAARNPPGNQSVGDRWNLAFPIGTGVRLTDEVALDLETVIGNPIRAHGTAGTAIDPGIVDREERPCSAERLGRDWFHRDRVAGDARRSRR
jgi:hypothetical protein